MKDHRISRKLGKRGKRAGRKLHYYVINCINGMNCEKFCNSHETSNANSAIALHLRHPPPIVQRNNVISISPQNITHTPVSVQVSKIPVLITNHMKLRPTIIRERQMVKIPCNHLINQHTNTNSNLMLPRFCLINARSLNRKTDKLLAFMAINKIDIAAVTETWLHNDIGDEQVSIDDYIINRNDRLHSKGGGICLYLLQEILENR
jgi:hypothetical protein